MSDGDGRRGTAEAKAEADATAVLRIIMEEVRMFTFEGQGNVPELEAMVPKTRRKRRKG